MKCLKEKKKKKKEIVTIESSLKVVIRESVRALFEESTPNVRSVLNIYFVSMMFQLFENKVRYPGPW